MIMQRLQLPHLPLAAHKGAGTTLAASLVAVCQALAQPGNPGHRNLFPLDARSSSGLVLAAAALFIAAGGGIGGGALLVPIFIIIIGFTPSSAVALSSITIVGGSLANFTFNVMRRHPSGDKPLIDWDLILVMEPTTIVGALLGSYVNKVLPPWLTTMLLAMLLLFLSQQLLRRGVRTYKAESLENAQAADRSPDPTSHEDNLRTLLMPRSSGEYHGDWTKHSGITSSVSLNDFVFDDSVDAAAKREYHRRESLPLLAQEGESNRHAASSPQSSPQSKDLRDMEMMEWRQVPWQHVVILTLLTAAVIGSDIAKARVACGSGSYWAISGALLPLTVVILVGAGRWLVHKHDVKTAAGADLSEGEVVWTKRNVVVYPAVCSLAGLVAGMFGVGGGIVKGPLMLEMGLLPDVAAASSATMIMFTSISASTVYVGFGAVKADYGIALFLIGLGVTMVGQLAAHQMMTKLKRRSIVVFSMATLLTLAAVVMVAEAAVETASAVRQGALLDWGSIC